MQDKQAKIKRDRENETNLLLASVGKTHAEEAAIAEQHHKSKLAEQQKWRETWEAEMRLKHLQLSLEDEAGKHKRKDIRLPPQGGSLGGKEGFLPLITSGSLTSRAASLSPVAPGKAAGDMFITSQPDEESAVEVRGRHSRKSHKNNSHSASPQKNLPHTLLS